MQEKIILRIQMLVDAQLYDIYKTLIMQLPAILEPDRYKTGPIIYYANDHHDCRDKEYQFNYKKVGDSWRAYILRMPSLCGRDGNGSVTHRLYDGNSPYVCWDSPVETLKDMQTISKVWADSIQEYIATGKRFG